MHENTLLTPPTDGHILGGVTRDFIIQLAKQNGITVAEKYIPEDLLFRANEVWISSTIREILPVTKINQQIISNGVGGPMWFKMINLYREFRNSL